MFLSNFLQEPMVLAKLFMESGGIDQFFFLSSNYRSVFLWVQLVLAWYLLVFSQSFFLGKQVVLVNASAEAGGFGQTVRWNR